MVEVILGIESSCDETAVALVDGHGRVLFQALESQIELHNAYGGVVPELASRSHFDVIDVLVERAVERAQSSNVKIRAVAATRGPGLVGPLIVGATFAEGLARGWQLPCVGVHHLRGHLASVLLQEGTDDTSTLEARAQKIFPAIVLLVSGGHTQVLSVDDRLRAQTWAQSADDAAGECFDKSAKLMGLPYPGGPSIEKKALELQDADRGLARQLFKELPRPKSPEGFSFAGLKTAIRLKLEKTPELSQSPAFCWAIQEAICDTLLQGLTRSLQDSCQHRSLVFCGGVSANMRIRSQVKQWASQRALELYLPPLKYCTDNAAMIAACAWLQDPTLDVKEVRARLPMELA